MTQTKPEPGRQAAPAVILHLLNGFGDESITRIVQRLVQRLGQDIYSWHVGGMRGLGDMQEELRHLGAQVVDFSDGSGNSQSPVKRVRAYIRDHQIELVHSHTPRTIFAATIARGFNHQPIHLATKHILHRSQDRRGGMAYMLIDRASLYLPDHLVAVSETMRNEIAAHPGLNTKRVTVIRNAIACDSYHVPDQRDPCRAELGVGPESPLIGFAGRIVTAKRLDLLLEGFSLALARHPLARLVLIGQGKARARLEAAAAREGIAHAVLWTGFRKDVPRLLAAMDIYIQPSGNEGLSLGLLEAMAAGKPIIATDVGGTSEVVLDGKTGILIPSHSSSAIGAALIDLLGDPDKRSALATAGKALVVREFGVERMMDAYGRLYQSLLMRAQACGREPI